jgi:hypothetical protein
LRFFGSKLIIAIAILAISIVVGLIQGGMFDQRPETAPEARGQV